MRIKEYEYLLGVRNLLSFVWNLYGNYDFGMDYWTLDFCMELFDEEETINPYFFL